ncbi:MAG: hypothetical protein WC992_07475 [Acholeplasmataceae bacterium]
MLERTNRNKMAIIAIILGVVVVFDFFTIITNIYIAPVLDGYGLPDILIYIKTIVFLLLFVIILVWLKQKEPKFPKSTLKSLMILGIVVISFYFISLYLYKYILISDTADIIKERILNGNPATYLDFSGINYRTLTYVLTIFSGFNSELILFGEALAFLMAVYSVSSMREVDEVKHVYDPFMFDVALFPIVFVWSILSFLSINILSYRFDMLGSLEMGLAIAGFLAVATLIAPAFRLYKNRDNEATRSHFIGTYKHLLFVAIFSLVLYIALFGLNVTFVGLGRHTYRLYTSFAAIIFSGIVLFRVYKILSLENK